MEALSGFFKRHPEKKTQCPSRYSSNKDVTDIALHEVLIGIVIGAIVVAVGIFVSVMKFDALVKSRHTGENRCPGIL